MSFDYLVSNNFISNTFILMCISPFHYISSSHMLEHVSHRLVVGVIKEWRRALRKDGVLLLSVPDMESMARMILDPAFDKKQKYVIMLMWYGGQVQYTN